MKLDPDWVSQVHRGTLDWTFWSCPGNKWKSLPYSHTQMWFTCTCVWSAMADPISLQPPYVFSCVVLHGRHNALCSCSWWDLYCGSLSSFLQNVLLAMTEWGMLRLETKTLNWMSWRRPTLQSTGWLGYTRYDFIYQFVLLCGCCCLCYYVFCPCRYSHKSTVTPTQIITNGNHWLEKHFDWTILTWTGSFRKVISQGW